MVVNDSPFSGRAGYPMVIGKVAVGETLDVWVPTIVTIIIAFLANGASLLLWCAQRQKLGANAAGAITDSALKMVNKMAEQVDHLTKELEELKVEYLAKIKELENRITVLERENERLRRGVTRLEGQIMSMGVEPVWKLSEKKEE